MSSAISASVTAFSGLPLFSALQGYGDKRFTIRSQAIHEDRKNILLRERHKCIRDLRRAVLGHELEFLRTDPDFRQGFRESEHVEEELRRLPDGFFSYLQIILSRSPPVRSDG